MTDSGSESLPPKKYQLPTSPPGPNDDLSDDNEAAQLVMETYLAYVNAATRVFNTGSDPHNVLAHLSTDRLRPHREQVVFQAAVKKLSATGEHSATNPSLVERTTIDGLKAYVATFCVDSSQVIVTNPDGSRQPNPEDIAAYPIRATVVTQGGAAKLHSIEKATEGGVCP